MAKKQVKKPARKSVKKTTQKQGSNSHIHTLEIKNFKSIKHIKIEPKRINLFIGRPNVGKSNVLEAISLFGNSENRWRTPFLAEQIRYETFDNIFYDRDTEHRIEVVSNLGLCSISRLERDSWYDFVVSSDPNALPKIKQLKERNDFTKFIQQEWTTAQKPLISPCYVHVSNKGDSNNAYLNQQVDSIVRKYDFQKQFKFENLHNRYLAPPYGDNQYAVIRKHKNLHKEIASLFADQKLKFVIKSEVNVVELQKQSGRFAVSFPYSGIADTLQRYIFYLLAIKTNKNAVLLLEEPEAHSFPAYVRQIAEMMIADDQNNQYFVTTHSPFILNIILEKARREDVAVFKINYKNFKTIAEPLSEDEISDYLSYGTDIFFQLLK